MYFSILKRLECHLKKCFAGGILPLPLQQPQFLHQHVQRQPLTPFNGQQYHQATQPPASQALYHHAGGHQPYQEPWLEAQFNDLMTTPPQPPHQFSQPPPPPVENGNLKQNFYAYLNSSSMPVIIICLFLF